MIDELRPMLVTTNATTTNGGLFVAKGVNFNDFMPAGTTISASASTVDNLKLVYWLADAATVTNTVGAGLMLDTQTSTSQHDAYVLNGTTSVIVYKYNELINKANEAAAILDKAVKDITETGSIS